ncbi:MAG: twin-arginine translocation signal domain-containing protein, partial [Planctomycetota bacterium]
MERGQSWSRRKMGSYIAGKGKGSRNRVSWRDDVCEVLCGGSAMGLGILVQAFRGPARHMTSWPGQNVVQDWIHCPGGAPMKTRREFLGATAAAAGAVCFPCGVLGKPSSTADTPLVPRSSVKGMR